MTWTAMATRAIIAGNLILLMKKLISFLLVCGDAYKTLANLIVM